MDREIIRRPLDGVDSPRPLRASELREQRVQQLLESCEQQILQQIIGPFGLTPAMFDDKDGGNVTTTHNFKEGVVATDDDRARHSEWQTKMENGADRREHDAVKNKERIKILKEGKPIHSAYTGEELSRDGQMHLDHVVSIDQHEKDPRANLFQSKSRRVEILAADENLVPAESSINMSMGARDKMEWAQSERKKDRGKTNAESFGIDESKLDATYQKAKQHVDQSVLTDQVRKQGAELYSTSLEQAKSQALRRALGILLHEFVQGSVTEVKRLLAVRETTENFLDELGASLKQVITRVIAKLKDALQALVSGGIEGVISNLLSFLINSFITTAAKVVTLIRESMHSLWRAIKLVLNPPPHMSGLEVAREATKIIAAAVVVGLGMMIEESIKAFILTIPFLKPIVDLVAPAVTAIVTGLTTALVIYGLDRLFDAMASKGTELLEAMHANSQSQAQAIGLLENWLQEQLDTSRLYAKAAEEYERIQQSMSASNFNIALAATSAEVTTQARQATIDTVATQYERKHKLQQQLDVILLGSSNPKIA